MASRLPTESLNQGDLTSSDRESILQQGVTCQRAGDLETAEHHYDACLAAQPTWLEALHAMAVLRMEQGRWGEAREFLAKAIAQHGQTNDLSRLVPSLKALCAEFGRLRRQEDLAASFELLLKIWPNNIEALNGYCRTLQELGRLPEALAASGAALSFDPRNAVTHLRHANSLQIMQRFEEAIVHYETALSIDPGLPTAHKNMAGVLNVLGREEAAIRHLDTALQLTPGDTQARASKGLFALGIGRFAEGWNAYEGRFGPNLSALLAKYPQPRWDGEDVDGTLLVWGEQGLGDQILYAGMLPDLIGRARRIVLEVEPRLVDLFTRSFPAIEVVAQTQEARDGSFAAQEPLGSLGRYLRLDWDAFPERPQGYLKADVERAALLRQRLASDERRVVGLSWKTQNAQHTATASAGLGAFAELLRQPGCRFVDLQYGDTEAERFEVERALGIRIEHLDDIDNRDDIDGLAALMAACDVVVTTGNITAHLAGALGVPTWAFVPYGHGRSWYWFKGRDDSPWYSRLRIKSQADGQTWTDLIAAAVRHEISASIAGATR